MTRSALPESQLDSIRAKRKKLDELKHGKIVGKIMPDPSKTFISLVGRVFFDSWLFMLTAGALGHELGIPELYQKFGYLESILLVVALQAVWPITSQSHYIIRKIKG